MSIFIYNAKIVDQGSSYLANLLIENNIISKIITENLSDYQKDASGVQEFIDATGKILIPGVIDDQVHFREPGATHKGNIETESAAAVLGGVCSFMDMPNNNPPVCTLSSLEDKFSLAKESSYANYSFYLGANNENIDQIKAVDPKRVCGVKVFMGSSTGNMLVDKGEALENIFQYSPILIATHCEQEELIVAALQEAKDKYGEDIPFSEHPNIRSRQACIKSSSYALELAKKYGTKLHLLHISTKEELEAIQEARLSHPNISGEVCVHYLWFNDKDYQTMGSKVKCNPAIKSEADMQAIIEACSKNLIQVLATDHAPHLFSEKQEGYLSAPSGLPLVQHSLRMMLEIHRKGLISLEQVVKLMCNSPAEIFNIDKRGFIKEGYYADLVILKDIATSPEVVSKENIAYKCEWSPLEGEKLSYAVDYTIINGTIVVKDSKLTGEKNAKRLEFNR